MSTVRGCPVFSEEEAVAAFSPFLFLIPDPSPVIPEQIFSRWCHGSSE
jgi:hypothetical protein